MLLPSSYPTDLPHQPTSVPPTLAPYPSAIPGIAPYPSTLQPPRTSHATRTEREYGATRTLVLSSGMVLRSSRYDSHPTGSLVLSSRMMLQAFGVGTTRSTHAQAQAAITRWGVTLPVCAYAILLCYPPIPVVGSNAMPLCYASMLSPSYAPML
eukprot:335605-Rhodomonas_salina.2